MSTALAGGLLLGAPIALAAGALSFASPCVLPLVPGYLGYLGGLDSGGEARRPGRRLVLGAALFVLGFSVLYVATSFAFAAAGFWLLHWQDTITRIAGAVVILLGLVFVGGIGPLQRIAKPGWRPRAGLAGAPLLGAVFAVGWTPCSGPTLSIITTMSLSSGSAGTAVLLALIYSLGLGIPFVLLAGGLGWATGAVVFLKRHVRAINLAGGALLVAVGLLMVTGVWSELISTIQASLGSYESPI